MICPKCGGQSVFPAMNEAPEGVRDWRKCLSCGKRWDPITVDDVDTIKRAFEEWQPGDEADEATRQDEAETIDREIALDEADEFESLESLEEPVVSPTDLAMKDVLVKRERKKKEDRMAIGGRCTARGCQDDAASDSVKCPHHRDVQRVRNANYQGRPVPAHLAKSVAAGGGQRSTPKGKPGRSKAVPASVVSVTVAHVPETLSTPRPVVQYDGVLNVIDAAIVSAQADVHALERTREILSRQSA